MVTFFKTLDVTPLLRLCPQARLTGIQRRCSAGAWAEGCRVRVEEFCIRSLWDVQLLRYDSHRGEHHREKPHGAGSAPAMCPSRRTLRRFQRRLPAPDAGGGGALPRTTTSRSYMVIGTSAIVETEIDGAVGMNSGIFQQPLSHLGQIPQGPFPNDAEALVPVPPHADGRRTRRAVSCSACRKRSTA